MKRVSILVLIACACFASVAWGQKPKRGIYPPWAEFHRHDMRRSNPCEKVLNIHNVGSLGLKWRSAGGGPSSPAVADGVVYVGGNDGYLEPLDAGKGNGLWSDPVGDETASFAAVANGV